MIAAYATRRGPSRFPVLAVAFDNITIRLIGSDNFPFEAKQQAAMDLTTAARVGALTIPIGDPLPLEKAAAAYDRVGQRQSPPRPARHYGE